MTLSEYIGAIKRGWVVILATFVLAVACGTGLVLTRAQAPVYTCTARLYIETVAGPSQASNSAGVDFTMNRTASYAAVLGGNLTSQKVNETLGESGDETVTVSAPTGTVIIDIMVTSSDPQRAADVTEAYLEIAPSVIEDLDRDGGEPRVKVTTFDEAGEPVASAGRSWVPILLAAALFGLGLGVSIVLVREMLRREEAERARDSEGITV